MDNLNQLFIEAGTLMLVGMIFVYSFLGLLVLIINKVLTPLAKIYPDPVIQAKRKPATAKSTQVEGISPPIVAAISAAVNTYRQQHKKP